jgi:O-antigen ligase
MTRKPVKTGARTPEPHSRGEARAKHADASASTAPAEDGRSRIVEIALLGLCLGILALRVTYTEAPTAQVLLTPDSLTDTVYSLTLSGLLIFAFVFWLLWRIWRNRPAYRVTGIEIGLALFLAAATISTLVASDKRTAITQTIMLVGPVFAALLLAQILDSHTRIRVVLVVVAALGMVSAYQCAEQLFLSNAITIEQYEKDPQILLSPLGIEAGTFQHFLFEHRLYSRGVRGFFTTSNSAASFAVMACFATIGLLVRRFQDCRGLKLDLRYDLLPVLALLVIATGLFLTQSKGGILAFIACLVVLAALVGINRWLGRHRRLATASFAFLVLLLAAGVGSAAILYGIKHGRLPGGNSMLVRWQYWAASARMYADHPLTGIGPGNFGYYYPHYKPAPALESVSDPHNFLLSLATQYGPLGLLGFLAMVCVPLWQSIASSRKMKAADETLGQSSYKVLALVMLSIIGVSLLLIRPFLIPTVPEDDFGILLYQITALYITPAAAFLIGFLLVAAPFEDRRGWQTDGSRAALLAALAGGVLAVLLHNVIDFAIFEPGVWVTFWSLLACLVAARLQRETGPCIRPAIRSTPVRKAAALGIAAALLGSYCWFVWKPAYSTTAAIQQAQQAASAGRFNESHRLLDAATNADPLSSVLPNVDGRLYLHQYEQTSGKQTALLEQAARCFQKAVEANPADYKNYEKLANVCDELEQKQKAYEWYLKAAQLYPGCDRLWFALGQTAEKLGKTGEALNHYTKAVAIEDGYRRQFRQMYPTREKVISRLGEKDYLLARKRMEELSK